MSGNKLLKLVFEDTQCRVYEDELNQERPIHFLVVPKIKPSDAYNDEKLLGHLVIVAGKVAVRKGLQNTGYQIVVDEDCINSRFNCLHVIGKPLQSDIMWPIPPGCRL